MGSQADFYHTSVSSHKPRIFLTLGSTKFRVSQEVSDFFSVGRRCHLKILSRELKHKELHFRHLNWQKDRGYVKGVRVQFGSMAMVKMQREK